MDQPSHVPSDIAHRRCLIVEDEPILAAMLVDTLADAGFDTAHLDRGESVVEWVRRESPAVVLLDVVLPGGDGFAICRAIRAFSRVPLIMITGKVEEADRLRGFDLGADDYICKPFHAAEVAARVRALLRRSIEWREASPGSSLDLDEPRMEARWRGATLDLTPLEFRLLATLGKRPGRVYSRNELLDTVYSDGRAVSDRTIDSHVKNLRRKLAEVEAEGAESSIESIYGVGYKFKA